MKTVHDSPDVLILDHRPIWGAIFVTLIALMCAGIGLWRISIDFNQGLNFLIAAVVFGLGINFLVIRRTTLTLNRNDNTVEWCQSTMLGKKRRAWALQDLKHAVLDTKRMGDGSERRTTYRAMLEVTGGADPGQHQILRPMAGGAPGQCVKAINKWLKA